MTLPVVFVLLAVAMTPSPRYSTGRVFVSGASVLSDVLAGPARERFPELRWESEGCGAGFVGLLSGTADVAMSSRPPSKRELRLAKRLGLRLHERVIGLDALAVIVHPDNRVDELTLAQLASLYSGGVVRWMGVGGADESTTLLAPSRLSGTSWVFREGVLGGKDLAASVEWIEPGGDIVGRVANDVRAVGFVSMSSDRASVKTLRIDGVAPTREAVVHGAYPLWYPLFLYTLGEPTGGTHRFLSWLFLQEGQSLLIDAGFVAIGGTAPLRRTVVEAVPAPVRVLFRAQFPPGSARLLRAERDALDAVVERARRSSDTLLVVGHSAAGEGDGDELSAARARAVSELITRRGLAAERLELESVGAAEPISSDPASNRRVDIWLLPRR